MDTFRGISVWKICCGHLESSWERRILLLHSITRQLLMAFNLTSFVNDRVKTECCAMHVEMHDMQVFLSSQSLIEACYFWYQHQNLHRPGLALSSGAVPQSATGTVSYPPKRKHVFLCGQLFRDEQFEALIHRIHGAGIYANIWGILMGSMLPYIAAPWIRHG